MPGSDPAGRARPRRPGVHGDGAGRKRCQRTPALRSTAARHWPAGQEEGRRLAQGSHAGGASVAGVGVRNERGRGGGSARKALRHRGKGEGRDGNAGKRKDRDGPVQSRAGKDGEGDAMSSSSSRSTS